jgi:hypothetical protein
MNMLLLLALIVQRAFHDTFSVRVVKRNALADGAHNLSVGHHDGHLGTQGTGVHLVDLFNAGLQEGAEEIDSDFQIVEFAFTVEIIQ